VSEFCSLRWDQVDFDSADINISGAPRAREERRGLVDNQPIGRWRTLTLLVSMAKPITQLP
jgi:hypothetical protein